MTVSPTARHPLSTLRLDMDGLRVDVRQPAPVLEPRVTGSSCCSSLTLALSLHPH